MVLHQTGDTLQLVVIGLVAIAAISMAAATIDSAQPAAVGGSELIGDLPVGDSPTNPSTPDGPSTGTPPMTDTPAQSGMLGDVTQCVRFLSTAAGGLLYFGAFGGLLYGIKRRYTAGTALLSVYGLLPIALVVYFLNTSCNYAGGGGGGSGGSSAGAVEQLLTTTPANVGVSPLWLAGLFGVVLVGAAAVLLRASGDQTVHVGESEDETTNETPDVADLAAAAGAAADRLSEHDADVDNEVYRAWYEMTSLLDVSNPDSYTPGEFADAAVEVGMNREDVEELTTLFNEVRYGKRDAESREALALDVFRNIEAAYGADAERTEHDGR